MAITKTNFRPRPSIKSVWVNWHGTHIKKCRLSSIHCKLAALMMGTAFAHNCINITSWGYFGQVLAMICRNKVNFLHRFLAMVETLLDQFKPDTTCHNSWKKGTKRENPLQKRRRKLPLLARLWHQIFWMCDLVIFIDFLQKEKRSTSHNTRWCELIAAF